jgi:hypothetical protein
MRAVKKMASKDVAPGPDGIPGRIWAETIDLMAPRLRHLFNRCMREGVYPRRWRGSEAGAARKGRKAAGLAIGIQTNMSSG